MKDEDKSRQQLIDELIEMRQRMAALEASEKKHEREEEALLQRTSELRAIFRAFPDLYFRLGPDGTIVVVGHASTPSTCEDGLALVLDRESGAPLWSKTFDGSFATADCDPEFDPHSDPPVDNDSLTGVAVDQTGRIFVAGNLLERHRGIGFLQELTPKH